jgi:catalase
MKRILMAAAAAAWGSAMLPAPALAQASPAEVQVNALEGLFGKQAGFRRSQAKGVCASGYFEGNAVGRSLSTASVFSGERVPVVARFSVGGGNPKASDKSRSARGLALQFSLPAGETWMTANISAPMYFVSKPEQFAPFLQVRTPDPATGYGSTPYWSTNAFELVNAKGQGQFVRWQFVPEAGTQGLTDEQMKSMPDEFLGDELRMRVAAKPLVFDFKLQLADPQDQTTDPTQVWPDSRAVVPAGRLVLDKVEPAAGGSCDRITFNPLVLPKGFKPSADPVLLARPAPYGLSLGRRLSEAAK